MVKSKSSRASALFHLVFKRQMVSKPSYTLDKILTRQIMEIECKATLMRSRGKLDLIPIKGVRELLVVQSI